MKDSDTLRHIADSIPTYADITKPEPSDYRDNEFDSYVVHGNTATRNYTGGWTVTAKIVHDEDSDISDYDCYSEGTIQSWKDDEWQYYGLVLSVAKNGVVLDQHAASLWGIEGNYPGSDNSYFSEVFDDLEEEALRRGADVLKTLNRGAL